MHPLNPFLRAFFRSTVPGQCVPVENHVRVVNLPDHPVELIGVPLRSC